ncbi:MAG: hypothetical protein JNL57_00160 [Bacteroidetes bacterium]|nr:hypothetical protein [Bacteroidota bacterium]
MKTSLLYLAGALLVLLSNCKPSAQNEPIPTGPVNLTIDLNLSSNLALNTPGNFAFFEGGVKGVLVVHDYDDNWYAFERTCAWEPLSACNKIWVDTLNIRLHCGSYDSKGFTPCCSSEYQFNGFPSRGPARARLAEYRLNRNGNLLYVYN